jgi:prepilin-type N-terminal cleavage/methylation domain-containing protein
VTRSESQAPRMHSQRGFTLVELLVALVVGAIVVLGGRLMFESVADARGRLAGAARRANDEANAEHVLRATVGALEVGPGMDAQFGGDEHETRFTSWCDTPGGWKERCAVTLSITGDRGGTGIRDSLEQALVLQLAQQPPVRVRKGFAHGGLRYLLDAHDGGTWMRLWDRGLAAPLAIVAIMDADTLILGIGNR